MKRLIWGTAILFVVSATSAYADSIPILNVNITYATVHMGPNDGSGDNVSFRSAREHHRNRRHGLLRLVFWPHPRFDICRHFSDFP